jgi:tRNA (cmo5U34)-methyltransferase
MAKPDAAKPTPAKSTVDEIRARFDADVDRFSNLETGQSATVDAPYVLDLVTESASATTPYARSVLDVGCGAGNFTLKLLERLPNLDCTLVDLSRPMLDRAVERIAPKTSGRVESLQGDIRQLELGEQRYDVILAAAVLHHLREDEEWEAVFAALYRALRPGGALWIADLVTHDLSAAGEVLWQRYGEYLKALRDEVYRDQVFAYIDREDTPRSLVYQLDLMRRVGFERVDVLHKRLCFAAFGGVCAG